MGFAFYRFTSLISLRHATDMPITANIMGDCTIIDHQFESSTFKAKPCQYKCCSLPLNILKFKSELFIVKYE